MNAPPPPPPESVANASSVLEQYPEVLTILKEKFPSAVQEISVQLGDWVAVVAKRSIPEVMLFLRDDPRTDFKFLMDLSAVDGQRLGLSPRFYMVYHLFSLTHKHRLRIKAFVGEEDLIVPSLVKVWPAADWFEREVWDMFGIRFLGHHHLKRILMYEGFEGHPLRKDYPVNLRQPLIGPKN